MSEKHEKGFEFEKKVAEFFRKRSYNKVLIRERIKGKSGFKHEIDVLVFDNLDQNKMVWACQCKYWNAKVGIDEIKKWIQTCEDINVKPAFVSLRFSAEAKKYAEAYGVYWITDNQLGIEPSQVIGEDFLSWKKKLDPKNSELDKFLVCLKSIYQTKILQNAERAKNEPELNVFEKEKPQLFKLFRDVDDQRLTKFLMHINRIKDKDFTLGYAHAFGPLNHEFQGIRLPFSLTDIPSEIDQVLSLIKSVLNRFNVGNLEPFKINYGDKCRIFLESWIVIADSILNIEKEIEVWRTEKNRDGGPFYKSRNYAMKHESNMVYDKERGIIIGKPEKIKNYFRDMEDFWKFYLRNKKDLDIKKLGLLFKTDLTCVDKEDKWPVIDGKEDSCEIFRRSIIIKRAYENNKSKVEKVISDLKTEQ